MGGDKDFKQDMLVWGIFSEILVEKRKRVGEFHGLVGQRGELVEAGQFFLNELQK